MISDSSGLATLPVRRNRTPAAGGVSAPTLGAWRSGYPPAHDQPSEAVVAKLDALRAAYPDAVVMVRAGTVNGFFVGADHAQRLAAVPGLISAGQLDIDGPYGALSIGGGAHDVEIEALVFGAAEAGMVIVLAQAYFGRV